MANQRFSGKSNYDSALDSHIYSYPHIPVGNGIIAGQSRMQREQREMMLQEHEHRKAIIVEAERTRQVMEKEQEEEDIYYLLS